MRFVLKTCLALSTTAIFFSCKDISKLEEAPQTAGLNKAMYQEYLMTRDPQLNYVPKERLLVAQNTMRNLIAARVGSSINNMTWQERGPNNIGGRTRAIIVDKRDASGNTVFAASVSGGIFKTTNFLSNPPTWTPVNDKLQNLAINAMVQDPVNHNTMYAGTGEGWFNVDAVKGVGIFKSTDGGVTWNLLSSTTAFEYVQDMVIDNNGNVYAALRPGNNGNLSSGIVRSINGGASWVQVAGAPLAGFTTGRAADLEVATNGDIYATLGIFSNTQVFKSSFSLNGANTGAAGTWTNITPLTINGYRADLAVAPSNPQRLYLAVQDKNTDQVKIIYKSIDAGVTWDSLPAPTSLNNGINSQAWFNLIVQVDPTNPDVVLVGALHVVKSTDAGANWSEISSSNNVHVDQHVLHFINSSSLIVGNDGGIYFSPNANTGLPSFTNKNSGYNVTQFYAADVHPTQTNYFLAGAQDNNTQRFNQAGMNSTTAVSGGDGGFAHIDQTNGQLQITSYVYNNYFRSTNGGSTFSQLSSTVRNNEGQFINPTDLDDNSKVLYAGHASNRYYYITDMAGTPVGNTNTVTALSLNGSMFVTAVKVDPFNANTVWFGASLGNHPPVVLKISSANTASFNVEVNSILPVPGNAYVSSIDIDPANPNHLVATLSNYGVQQVLESSDGGSTWNTIKGNLPDMPVRWAVIAPTNAQLNGTGAPNGGIIIGTELGVWTTSQPNAHLTQWVPQADVPNVRTDMLRYRPSDRLLLAATHGRGVWTTTIPTGSGTGVSGIQNTKNFIKYINATPQQVNIKVGNLNTNTMQMRIFDINGRLVRTIDSRYSDQTINIGSLSSGSYIIKVFGNRNEQYTYRFIK